MNIVGGLVKPELDNSYHMSYTTALHSKYSQKGLTIFEMKRKILFRFLSSQSPFVGEKMKGLQNLAN